MVKTDFLSSDHITMVNTKCWLPQQKPVAIVQIIHGMMEFIERYEDFAQFLTTHGFIVIGHDHLGHGDSITKAHHLGHTKGTNYLLADIELLFKQTKKQYPELPYFFLGHSMGSYLLRKFLADYNPQINGAVIMGTGTRDKLSLTVASKLTRALSIPFGKNHPSQLIDSLAFGSFNRKFWPHRTKKDWLTRDTHEVDRYLADPRTQFLFSLSSYHDLFQLILDDSRLTQVKKIDPNLPLLFISGEKDPVGDFGHGVKQVVTLFTKARHRNHTLHLYADMRHELLNEIDKQIVYDDLLTWFITNIK